MELVWTSAYFLNEDGIEIVVSNDGSWFWVANFWNKDTGKTENFGNAGFSSAVEAIDAAEAWYLNYIERKQNGF